MNETDEAVPQAPESTDREQEGEISFFPALWQQRRNLARSIIDENHATSVIDFGCGEAALMSFLCWESTGDYPITRLAGVDMDETRLPIADDECQPREFELGSNVRVNELTVEIFQGSVAKADQRMLGYDALACLEVVEHLDPDVLEKFWSVVLGTLRPKLVIVSTPNAEFNVYFPQLKYGTPEAILRNDDHRFEWTRQEFQDWCNPAAEQYGYSITFTGTGMLPKGDPAIGFCTQFAILKQKETSADTPPRLPTEPTAEHYKLFSKIEYPVYETKHTEDEMLAYLHDKIARIRPRPPRPYEPDEEEEYQYGYSSSWKRDRDEQEDQSEENDGKRSKLTSETEAEAEVEATPDETTDQDIKLGELELEDLWGALDVRQRCRRRAVMVRVLETSPLVKVDIAHDKIHFNDEDEFWKAWDRQYELDNPIYDPYANTMASELSDERDDDYEDDWYNNDQCDQTMGEAPVDGGWDNREQDWDSKSEMDLHSEDADSPWRSPVGKMPAPW
ncbi:hypothetical protein B0O80DRAFT_210929 [Mortierella sp. GBAus27b]|nr:Small RNA 2'-O-methyltransferase [Mortierella sp. GBA43]KAI8347475.1 hypothetical protein B0O80DRAFT_210929 [Mortierella sp. GBAus27b]